MKKLFYSFFAAAAMLFAASSCSQEEMIENGTSGDEVEVSFNVEMEGQTASRAIGDGLTVDQLFLAVYDENGNEIEALRQDEAHGNAEKVDNLGATATVRLVKGQTYQFVFWAQKSGYNHYDTSDMKQIKLNKTADGNYALNNDETRDAFYAYVGKTKITESFKKTVTLKRPFAQLNLATTAEDIQWAKAAGVEIDKSSVTVKGAVYSKLNTFTGYCSSPVEATIELNAIPDAATEKLTIKDTEDQFDDNKDDVYYYLSTSYLLASAKKDLSEEIVFTLTTGDTDEVINTLTVTNAPLQRNWRTNIIGEILTGEGTFNIVVDPIFDADRNYPMDGSELDIWDGTTTTPELVNGVYVIDQASDLIGLAEMDEASLTGATFELTKDLSFKNVETGKDTKPATIKPLFTEGTGPINVTFLGNDHVIRDFIIEDKGDFNSLFGIVRSGTIKNLTIINAEINGDETHANAWASIVAAKVYGASKFENVTVKDSKLTGGQKVGGLIGYGSDITSLEIVNCTVDGLNLENYDISSLDSDGSGSTGGLIGYIDNGNNKIVNSYVKNSTIKAIQSINDAKRANSEFIGVIAGPSVTEITNCGVENNVFTNTISDWTLYNGPFVGGNRLVKGYATLTVNGKTACATIDEVANALNAGKDVTLGASITAEKAIHINAGTEVTLDLNGHTISAGDNYTDDPKGLIRVDGGATVTIKNGIVDASTYDGNISAVTVPNGTLIIESGTFMTGDDGTDCNDVIMANPECQVIVNGGTFQYKGQNGQRWLYTLNRPNSDYPVYTYTVNGGTFYQFIPGTTNPDGWGYEVQLGADKKVYKNDETTPTTDTTPEAGAWYTVK